MQRSGGSAPRRVDPPARQQAHGGRRRSTCRHDAAAEAPPLHGLGHGAHPHHRRRRRGLHHMHRHGALRGRERPPRLRRDLLPGGAASSRSRSSSAGDSDSRKLPRGSRSSRRRCASPSAGCRSSLRSRSARRSRPGLRPPSARSPPASPSRRTTGGSVELVDQRLERVGNAKPGGGSRSRPAALTWTSLGVHGPSSRTARAAITFVLPGLEPMPSRASRPARWNSSPARAAGRSSSRGRRGRGSGSPPRGRRASRRGSAGSWRVDEHVASAKRRVRGSAGVDGLRTCAAACRALPPRAQRARRRGRAAAQRADLRATRRGRG